MQPTGNRVLVKPIKPPDKSEGGIHLVQQEGPPREGIVVAVGPGNRLKDGTRGGMTVQEGDHVLIAIRCGERVEHNGEEMLIISENELLGVVEHD